MNNPSPMLGAPAEEPCPICGGLGLVSADVPVGHPSFGKAFPCSCQAAKQKEIRAQRLRSMGNLNDYQHKTFATFQIDYDLLDDSEGDLQTQFANFDSAAKPRYTLAHRRLLRSAAELCYRYAQNPTGWLLLEGGYGTGKTHLAAAIANARLQQGESVLFKTAPDLLDYLKQSFSPASGVNYDEAFEQMRKAPLLVLDLGAEKQSEWAAEKLYQLFNDRYHLSLPTVITTNRNPAQLEGRLRSRLLDENLTHKIALHLPDRRQRGVKTWEETDLANLERYAEMTFANFELRTEEGLPTTDLKRLEAAIQTAQAYADKPADWLAIIGEPGSGKTHLAAAIAHLCSERYLAGQRPERPLFVLASDLIDYMRKTFQPDSATAFDARLEEVKTAGLLVLDRLAMDERFAATSWTREKFYDLLTYRFDLRLPTILTTSVQPENMDARLLSRIRNQSHCVVLPLTVPAYVGRSLKRRASPPKAR
jgi:DNA replication protein DnaC